MMILGPLSIRIFRCSKHSTRVRPSPSRNISKTLRKMATVNDSIPHVVRTAHEPRQAGMWQATLSKIDQINSTIRLLRLSLERDGPPLRHLPGQYVDLHIPGVPTVGGFTITSPPQTALSSSSDPYVELAIQKSSGNPPAAYLWQPSATILNSPMSFRIGGNFAYPPLTLSKQECENINQAVFIAGGVGINPIMSMISAMDAAGPGKLGGLPQRVRILYTSRRSRNEKGEPEKILFEERMAELATKWSHKDDSVDYKYTLFETAKDTSSRPDSARDTEVVNIKTGRIQHTHLLEALGPEKDRANTVVYICGVPQMTDEFVAFLQKQPGMDEKRVLCEKWW